MDENDLLREDPYPQYEELDVEKLLTDDHSMLFGKNAMIRFSTFSSPSLQLHSIVEYLKQHHYLGEIQADGKTILIDYTCDLNISRLTQLCKSMIVDIDDLVEFQCDVLAHCYLTDGDVIIPFKQLYADARQIMNTYHWSLRLTYQAGLLQAFALFPGHHAAFHKIM